MDAQQKIIEKSHQKRRISRSQEWYGFKGAIKKTVNYLPGYNRIMRYVSHIYPNKTWVLRLPVAKTDVDVFVGGQCLKMLNPDRCEIAKNLWWSKGIRVPQEDAVALNLFFELSRESEVILDVGSNSGLFSLVAAKSNGLKRLAIKCTYPLDDN